MPELENYIDVLIDIPCFACLFWKSERESYVNCNPIECQALTEWLQELAENSSTAKIFAVKDGELKIHLHKRRSHT
jgi:hypothetical protein